MVGGHNSGLWQVCVGMCEGRAKNERLLCNKQGQRRDVRAQCHDVLERGVANVVTLRSNVAMFQRGSKSNVATLGSNVTTFQRIYKPTSRRCREAIFQCRDVGIQRLDVPGGGNANVATLRANVATLQRRPKCKIFTRF